MTKSNLVGQVSNLSARAGKAFKKADSLEQLKVWEGEFLGKKSELMTLLKGMKELDVGERKEVGPAVQGLKVELQACVTQKRSELEKAVLDQQLQEDWMDVTKEYPLQLGSIHPISQVQREVEKIFTSMGFEIADGPEVETEWHNFDALNIPQSHPARDMQDTFWIKSGADDSHQNSVLRTHTSNLQIRYMQEHGVPVRMICPGRVYRNEAIDATHDATFYQVEGMMIDKGISLAHLKGTMKTMLSKLFGREVAVRLRPGYFPFVEPGVEVDFQCMLCDGKGCKTCKHSGYIEFMGAGMTHPNVLKNCGIDPNEYSGFAFGFGLTRLVMMKYGIDDIRLLFSKKKDFLTQF